MTATEAANMIFNDKFEFMCAYYDFENHRLGAK